MPQEPLEQKPSWANASTEIAGWESPWSVSASPSSGGAENSEEATAAGASFQRAVRRKFLVGAVGIEPSTPLAKSLNQLTREHKFGATWGQKVRHLLHCVTLRIADDVTINTQRDPGI